MHELSERELYQALEYAKSIDEENGRRIMAQFETDQPMLFQTVLGVFPSIIAGHNQDMAHLFMDLCFEVLCVYQKARGGMPKFSDDPTWMERQAILLETELQALMQDRQADESAPKNLHDRLAKYKENPIQAGLVKFLNESIDEFASDSVSRVAAIELTQAMIFIVVRLFNTLYEKPVKH